jgi:hypothetical protein
LLGWELFLSLEEAKYAVERWRLDYSHYRPHSGKYCFGKTPMQTFPHRLSLTKEKMLHQTVESVS